MSEENMDSGAENASEASDSGTETLATAAAPQDSQPAGTPAEGSAEKPADGEEPKTLMQEADGAKPDEGEAKNPEAEKPQGAPENYADFQAPEGVEFASSVVDAYKGVAKELNLTQDQAQMMIDKMTPVMQARYAENIRRISTEWAEKSKADPEIGGDNFRASMANVARVREAFARNADGQFDPDIAEFLNSPMGNHPGALKLLARAGAAISEGTFPTGGAAESDRYTAEDFYKDALVR